MGVFIVYIVFRVVYPAPRPGGLKKGVLLCSISNTPGLANEIVHDVARTTFPKHDHWVRYISPTTTAWFFR